MSVINNHFILFFFYFNFMLFLIKYLSFYSSSGLHHCWSPPINKIRIWTSIFDLLWRNKIRIWISICDLLWRNREQIVRHKCLILLLQHLESICMTNTLLDKFNMTVARQAGTWPVTLRYCRLRSLSKSSPIFVGSDDLKISPIYYRFSVSLSNYLKNVIKKNK